MGGNNKDSNAVVVYCRLNKGQLERMKSYIFTEKDNPEKPDTLFSFRVKL